MTTTDDVLAQRVANALIGDATPDLPRGVRALTPFLGPVLAGFRRYYGGLWVGGRAELTATHLTFRPNAMNRSLHAGDLDITVPLDAVEEVEVRWGLVTRIVAVRVGAATVTLRCYRAQEFADEIDTAARRSRT